MPVIPIPISDSRLSKMLQESFGWSWPPFIYPQKPSDSLLVVLPPRVIRYFRRLNPDTQQQLLRFKDEKPKVEDIEQLEELHKTTWTIRRIFLETIEKLYLNDLLDDSSPPFWKDDNSSELAWLRLMDFLTTKEKKINQQQKKIDYPIHINFIPCHPLQPNAPISTNSQVHVESIKHINMSDNLTCYWTIGFQDTTPKNPKFHDICFKRTNPFPNIIISNHLDRLGHIWIDKSPEKDQPTDHPTKKYRVLFQKTCSDLELGLFLWPQFNLKKIENKTLDSGQLSNFLSDTPKIPIYQGGIIELCDQDRLILFTTEYRSHKVFIDLQISIEFCWASQVNFDEIEERADLQNQKHNNCETPAIRPVWIDNLLQWPNPCERYSHYVQSPNSYPEFHLNDEEQDVQDTESGIVITQTDVQEPLQQLDKIEVTDRPTPLNADQDTSTNCCLFKPEETTNNLNQSKDKDERIPTPSSSCPLELLVQLTDCSSATKSSENAIIGADSNSLCSPQRSNVLGIKHQDQQADISTSQSEKLSSSQFKTNLLRNGKENNNDDHDHNHSQTKSISTKPKSFDNLHLKSVKRKSPRLIEMAHSNQPIITSKRKKS